MEWLYFYSDSTDSFWRIGVGRRIEENACEGYNEDVHVKI